MLFGRNVATSGGLLQNDHTDTPLVAWHQILPAAKPGHSMIEYSVAWSNEDGGTPAPALMAQWGRTTDIEWIYRVEVDAHGRRVPGSGVFQGPNHATSAFHGVYDGTHPLLQTCTSNNNVCDRPTLKALPEAQDPMRFALSTRDVLAADQPREHEMDLHPWTYQVMAREMLREHDVTDPASDPSLPGLADQRTYLYLALDQAPARRQRRPRSRRRPEERTHDVHLGPRGLPSLFTVHRWAGRDDGQAPGRVRRPPTSRRSRYAGSAPAPRAPTAAPPWVSPRSIVRSSSAAPTCPGRRSHRAPSRSPSPLRHRQR